MSKDCFKSELTKNIIFSKCSNFSNSSRQSVSRGAVPITVMPTGTQPLTSQIEDISKHMVYVLFPQTENGLHVIELDDNELKSFKQQYKDKEVLIMKSDLTTGEVYAGKTSCLQSFQKAVSSSVVTPLFLTTESQGYTSSMPVDERIAQLEAMLELKNQQYMTLDRMYVSTQSRLTSAVQELQRQRYMIMVKLTNVTIYC